MARSWTLEAARCLIRQWCEQRVDQAVEVDGLTARLEGLETFIIEQQPTSLAEAERLLDLISMAESPARADLEALCRVGGAVRNDIGRNGSRIEISFAPRASGPFAGRA